MKFLRLILLLLILSYSGGVNAQMDSLARAKLYYQQAQDQYNNKEYAAALFHINKTEWLLPLTSKAVHELPCLNDKTSELVNTNGSILSLKIKTYYYLEQFEEAEAAFRTFENDYMNCVADSLKIETLGYLPKIAEGATALRVKKAKAKAEAANLQKTYTYFRYEDCYRCDGTGEYLLTENRKRRQPWWWKKEKYRTCDVCERKKKLLYFDGNDSILGIPKEKFIESHRADIFKSLDIKKVQE